MYPRKNEALPTTASTINNTWMKHNFKDLPVEIYYYCRLFSTRSVQQCRRQAWLWHRLLWKRQHHRESSNSYHLMKVRTTTKVLRGVDFTVPSTSIQHSYNNSRSNRQHQTAGPSRWRVNDGNALNPRYSVWCGATSRSRPIPQHSSRLRSLTPHHPIMLCHQLLLTNTANLIPTLATTKTKTYSTFKGAKKLKHRRCVVRGSHQRAISKRGKTNWEDKQALKLDTLEILFMGCWKINCKKKK